MNKTAQNTRKATMTASDYFKNLDKVKTIEVVPKNVKLNVYIRDKVVKYHEPQNANKVRHDERINFSGFEYEDKNTLEIMTALASDLAKHLKEDKVYEIHCDPKKRKLMIRTNGAMIFKIFVQKNCYKVHLKNKSDYDNLITDTENVFYQNGFNLPYAYKTDLNTVHSIVDKIA